MDLDPRLRPGPSSPSPAGDPRPSTHGPDGPDNVDDFENPENPDTADTIDPKRPRACEACRGLKVRCDPDPDDAHAPCRRCRKAGRRCVVTAPSRKRQKKTDSRVSELERKIDALTASLQARGAAAQSAGASPSSDAAPSPAATAVGPMNYRPSVDRPSMGETMARDRSQKGSMPSMGPPERAPATTTLATAGVKRKASDRRSTVDDDRQASPRQPLSPSSPWVRPGDHGDIVDRAIVSMDLAADLFSRYTDRMAPHFPAVIFPPSMTASELRRSKPTLFLAIMAAASSEVPSLQIILQRELMTVLAEKVFLTGEKSLEIVQALLIAVIWYWPPEQFEELKFYQLVHVAAVMAIDIGLGKKAPPRRPGLIQSNWQQMQPFRRHGPPDPTTIESRRTWLGCYFLACNTSIALHRPNLVRWTPFMSESIDILQLSPDAAPTDSYFCHLVQQHRLGEDIGGQFSLDDAANVVDINDPRTQYALRALERDLDKLRTTIPEESRGPTLEIGYNMINLYMHEVALHTKADANQIRPPFNADNFKDGGVCSEPLSPAHISAISACLSSVDGIFTTFMTMDVAEARCLPVYNYVRVAYAVVILLKLYFSASAPGSELGKVIDKSNLRVEHYLDVLLDKFRRTAADDRSRPAAKFLVVLAMLKSWFIKHEKQEARDNNDNNNSNSNSNNNSNNNRRGGEQSSSSHQQRPQSQSQPQQPTVNTPLQLLSEVAAGTDAGASPHASGARFPSLSNIRQPHQPFFHDAATTSSPATPSQLHQHQHQQQHHQQQHMPSFSESSASWPTSQQQQQQQPPLPMDMTLLSSASGLDFPGMGFTPGGQEDGARIMLSDAWFSDVFEGFHSMQDPSAIFPF